jgi:hypothetical protein
VLAGFVPTPGDCRAVASASFTVRTPRPEATDDDLAVLGDSTARLDLIANDQEADGDHGVRPRAVITRGPSRGSVELIDEGVVLYTPDAGFFGSDSLTYTLCVGDTCSSADATIHVADDGVLDSFDAGEPTPEAAALLGEIPPSEKAVSPNASYVTPDRVVAQQASCSRSPLAWGGFSNGSLPVEQLSSIGCGHLLEDDAAGAFLPLSAAAAADGIAIGVTDSYRSYEAQVDVRRRKGHLVATATPGTSVHGWAKALDLVVRDPAVRSWLAQNAAQFGWINPPWAKRPGKMFEPWHYEFYGGATGSDIAACGGDAIDVMDVPAITLGAAPVQSRAVESTREPPAALVQADAQHAPEQPSAVVPPSVPEGAHVPFAQAVPAFGPLTSALPGPPGVEPKWTFTRTPSGLSLRKQVGIALGALAVLTALVLMMSMDVLRTSRRSRR